MTKFFRLALALLLALPLCAFAGDYVHHSIRVTVEPENGKIIVDDLITGLKNLPQKPKGFTLDINLKLEEPKLRAELSGARTVNYYLDGDVGDELRLVYSGVVDHRFTPVGTDYARGFMSTPGKVAPEGVFLSGDSDWVALFGDELFTFDLRVTLPQGWFSVSQGDLDAGDAAAQVWRCTTPMDEIYLIAAPFSVYTRQTGGVKAQVFLRTPDDALAEKYLDATAGFVEMYGDLIGPYPFNKFAAVENFWETGYGMPSFTLLGPKVIRLPFILRTSYPHEILHNWWGNSVYVDYSKGNWCEGLTAYLADHLMAEGQGTGAEYRETTLQKYLDYVAGNADGPLSGFVSRHSSSSEALGYGKSLMLFHMLRNRLGDEVFSKGLKKLYEDYKWKRASWGDVSAAFSQVSGQDLSPFFDLWVKKTGAPSLELADVKQNGSSVTGRVVQKGEFYPLLLPLAITVEGSAEAVVKTVELSSPSTEFSLDIPGVALRLDADPSFDLFRLLDKREVPPAISGIYGAKDVLIVTPSQATDDLKAAYGDFAKALAQGIEGGATVVEDSSLDAFPKGKSVWVLGYENKYFADASTALADYPVEFGADVVKLSGTELAKAGHSVVAVAGSGGGFVGVAATTVAKALPGLAKKLPHYHKYSYLGFSGDEPQNVAKGRFSAKNSPMTVFFKEGAAMGRLPAAKPLASPPKAYSAADMKSTIDFLAGDALAGRGFGSKGQELARDFITRKMQEIGLKPGAEGGWLQPFKITGGEPQTEAELANVVGILPGTNPDFAGQAIVVGAHYDGLGLGWPDARSGNKGKIHPSADDNASGVAVMLEAAKKLATLKLGRSVIFVAFAGEEAGRAGSRHFVSRLPSPDKIPGMVNVDTVGRLGNQKLTVFGTGTASEWMPLVMGAGFVAGAKVEAAKDIGSSDQTSFIEAKIPAVQLFAGPHPDYHSPADSADKMDYDGLVKVAGVVKEAVEYLATKDVPLRSTLIEAAAQAPSSAPRKVSLGIMPDFAHDGPGVKVSGVTPDSPAQKSGITEGDLLTALDGQTIADLKDFSAKLKTRNPGDPVKLQILRDGKTLDIDSHLISR